MEVVDNMRIRVFV